MSDTPKHDQRVTNHLHQQAPVSEIAGLTQTECSVLTIRMATGEYATLPVSVQPVMRSKRIDQPEITQDVIGPIPINVMDLGTVRDWPVRLFPNPAVLVHALPTWQREPDIADLHQVSKHD